MKKLLKLLLASFMVLSLAACSSDDEEPDDPDPVVDETTWRDELSGEVETEAAYYDGEVRDIIVQLEQDDTTIRFYFDEDEQNNYATISLEFGEADYETFFDYLILQDFNDDGYDDVQMNIEDNNHNEITIYYQFNTEYSDYECLGFDTLDGEPDDDYIDTWYRNADLDEDQFVIDSYGNWEVLNSAGEIYQRGFGYDNGSMVELYDMSGDWVGDIQIEEECLLVTIDGGLEYYYRESNSVAQ